MALTGELGDLGIELVATATDVVPQVNERLALSTMGGLVTQWLYVASSGGLGIAVHDRSGSW